MGRIRAGAKQHGCTQRAGKARLAGLGLGDNPTQGHGHEDKAQEWVLPSHSGPDGLAGPRSLPGLQGWGTLGQNVDFAPDTAAKAAGRVLRQPWHMVL